MQREAIERFVEEKMQADRTGHDVAHAYRVANMALRIAKEEHCTEEEREMIYATALLHDVIDHKLVADSQVAIREVRDFLATSDATESEIDAILHTMEHMSFSKNKEKKQTLSKLGEIVQDADRLDAIGAIGVARTFYYGGSKGHAMWHDEDFKGVHGPENSVVDHFHHKLLLLKDLMNTATAKQIAEDRTEFLKIFLNELEAEVKSNK